MLIITSVSFTFQKIDAARFTPYMEQCLRDLEKEKEYETDSLLAQLIRIQHLSDRIGQLHSKDQLDDNLPGIPRAPVSAYLNAFQTELDKFDAQIPRYLRSNSTHMPPLSRCSLHMLTRDRTFNGTLHYCNIEAVGASDSRCKTTGDPLRFLHFLVSRRTVDPGHLLPVQCRSEKVVRALVIV